jgi:hypothetical protein
MSVSDDISYFSRFLVKFVEIIAAGLATAASGYLIAHLTGALSPPAPAAAIIQVAPSTSMVSGSQPAQPIPSIPTAVNEQHLAPQQEVNAPPVARSARKIVNTTKAIAPRKHMETDTTNAVETKRDQQSLVARVRAALSNVDVDRTDPLDVSSRQGDVPRAPAAIGSQPRPVDDPPGAAAVTAAPPGAANLQFQPVQQAPIEPNPPTVVEIKSRPLADVQALPAPPAPVETGVFSALGQILRHDPLADTDQPPRPPMPVGQ